MYIATYSYHPRLSDSMKIINYTDEIVWVYNHRNTGNHKLAMDLRTSLLLVPAQMMEYFKTMK